MAGTRAALRAARQVVRGPARRAWLRWRPATATDAEVRAALGGRTAAAALRGPALAAMPTVAAFERSLEAHRESILERAEALAAHRFDLLGSGPVDLGREIDWQRDFKSGRSWPRVHISQVPVTFPDSSDIKVPWELSRFQHLPLLAAAHRLTGEGRFLDEIGAQLDSWIEGNPVEFGANWKCTMDVAIRAANWVAALAVCADAAEGSPWLDRAVGSLLLHGRFIRSHLEWAEIRGNHYLSDVVGLLAVSALFSGGEEGQAWTRFAADELAREMEHQVRPDGCDHEASIPYHRLVCELFVCGTQAVDALLPDRLQEPYRERLRSMLRFAAEYARPDGLAPQMGDMDSGRYLPLGDYGAADPRRHGHLFEQAGVEPPPAGGHAAFPDGGFWFMRGGDLYMAVRCGDVGLGGRGCHAHNDQLSFELALGEQPLVVDPGSFLYTADPAARNLFRSTGFHSTLRIGGGEQNPLREDYLFVMEDRSRAEAVAWEPEADGRARFTGRHRGFAALRPPALHERAIEFDGPAGLVVIEDAISSEGGHELEWTFPLAPGAAAEVDGAVTVRWGRCELRIEAPGVEFEIEPGWYSPAYGERERTPFVRARRRGRAGEDSQRFELRASAGPAQPERARDATAPGQAR